MRSKFFFSQIAAAWCALLLLGQSVLVQAQFPDPEAAGQKAAPEQPPIRPIGPGLFQVGEVTLDKNKNQLTFTSFVNLTNVLLEYALVGEGGKLHESLLVTRVQPYHLHVAMLLLGATNQVALAENEPAVTGQPVSILLSWEEAGKAREARLEDWICKRPDNQKMEDGIWIYNGSRMIEGRFLAQIEQSMISIIEDPNALINNPRPGRENDEIWFPITNAVPAAGTAVKITIQVEPPEKAKGKSVKSGADAQSSSVRFVEHVAPILLRKCESCHGPEKSKGAYRLDTFQALMKPGDSTIPSIVPNAPERSRLFQLVITGEENDRMPQKGEPLSAAEIQTIRRWIEEGAKFDGEDVKTPLALLVSDANRPQPPSRYPHPIPITALAFSPDGKALAVNGYHEVTVWNPETGRLLKRMPGVAQRTEALACSPDGKTIAVAGGTPGLSGEIALLDVETGAIRKVLARLRDTALDVCYSPDGTKIAGCGADNTIRLFDSATGRQIHSIEQHADWVVDIGFNSDASKIVSASRDKTARVFDVATGELETTFTDHSGPLAAVAFQTDGKALFSSGREKGVFVWSVDEAKRQGDIWGFGDVVQQMLVHSNLLFTCAGKIVRAHTTTDRKLKQTFEGHKDVVFSIAIDPEGRRLASGSYDGEVRIWNLEDGKMLSRFMAAPQSDAQNSSSARANSVEARAEQSER